MIQASIILDSTYSKNRLTTLELVYPRYILAQINTHRVFSRNTASSRAIPVSRTTRLVMEAPVIPIWNRNQPGMQGIRDVSISEAETYLGIWLDARNDAVRHAQRLADAGAHKQIVNRIIEPYLFCKTVLSFTEVDNFFNLRLDDAQPEIEILAAKIKNAIEGSEPRQLNDTEWHIPYILDEEEHLPLDTKLKISVARCARVSYKTFQDNKVSVVDKDIELYTSLLGEGHMSPFEHQARPLTTVDSESLQGNFKGFSQYRKMLGQ